MPYNDVGITEYSFNKELNKISNRLKENKLPFNASKTNDILLDTSHITN